MPSRKQRRRREKSFRHEYETVLIDEEGNEQVVAADDLRAEREARRTETKPQPAKGKSSRGSRPARVPPEPTWQRAFKRGGLMGAVMLVLFAFVLHGGSEVQRVGIAVVYGVLFIPLTYYVDRWTYRTYARRAAQQGTKK